MIRMGIAIAEVTREGATDFSIGRSPPVQLNDLNLLFFRLGKPIAATGKVVRGRDPLSLAQEPRTCAGDDGGTPKPAWMRQ